MPSLYRETQSLGQQMLNATVGINKTLRSIHSEKWISLSFQVEWNVVLLIFFPFFEFNRNLVRFLDKNEIVGEIAFRSIRRETGIGFSECTREKNG